MYFKNLDVKDFESLITKIEKPLKNKGWINHGFKEAIILREKKYPTGLEFPGFSVAIPHTDTKYVNIDAIIPIKLTNKIKVCKMATINDIIEVDTFFVLLVKEADKHIDKLAMLMDLFQQDEFTNMIKNINTNNNFEKINKILNQEV